MFPGNKQTPSEVADFFRSFYYGFREKFTIWFAYKDDDSIFELPVSFRFDTASSDDREKILFEAMIKPCILPANFFGKNQSATYEFYHPSVAARQLGFGQLPIGLYFADIIKPREIIPEALHYDRLKNLDPDSSTVDFDSWSIIPFTSPLFTVWWAEWNHHLFLCHPKLIASNLTLDI